MSSQPNSLHLNHEERRFLGVCAGIADYLDMPVVLVRIIFVISFLTWPTLILAYFALYFWLDRNLSTDKVSDWLRGSAPTRHLKNLDYRRPLYRNMRNRRIAGVCSGIADYLEVGPWLVRCVAILAALILGPYALLAYGVCWFVMEPNPASHRHARASRRDRRSRRHARRASRRRARSHHGLSSSRVNSADDDELSAAMGGLGDDYYGDEDLYGDDESLYDPDPDSVITDLERKRRSKKARKTAGSRLSSNEKSMEECSDTYLALENRLRDLEAFMTSRRFRLHCEISRI